MKGRQLGILAAVAALAVVLGIAACTPAAKKGPMPFTLVNQDGKPTTDQILRGKWSAVFFGYTYCPDFCPTTLAQLAQVETKLGSKAKDFQTVFITVDPERDTPAQLKLYVARDDFPKHLTGLTGTPEQVAAAAKTYGVYYAKHKEGDSYLMDHSLVTYLMNPKGDFACALRTDQSPEDIAKQVEAAMRKGADAKGC